MNSTPVCWLCKLTLQCRRKHRQAVKSTHLPPSPIRRGQATLQQNVRQAAQECRVPASALLGTGSTASHPTLRKPPTPALKLQSPKRGPLTFACQPPSLANGPRTVARKPLSLTFQGSAPGTQASDLGTLSSESCQRPCGARHPSPTAFQKRQRGQGIKSPWSPYSIRFPCCSGSLG